MSLKTKLLELFKYEPDKDGAQTFNIKQALNDNWDRIEAWAQSVKTALAKLVPTSRKVNGKALTEDVTLTAADIKMPDSEEDVWAAMAKRLLRYTQMWNEDDAPATADAVNQLEPGCYGFVLHKRKDWFPNELKDLLARYELIVHNTADCIQNGTLKLRCIDGSYQLMEYIGEILRETKGTTIRWRRVATCIAPEVHEFPFASGAQNSQYSTSQYFKSQESVVTLNVWAVALLDVGTLIGTLPEGYRPRTNQACGIFVVTTKYGAYSPAEIVVQTDGKVYCYGSALDGSEFELGFAVSFVGRD